MKRNFFLCGFLGWCLKIFWTSLHSLLNGQGTMMGKTSLLIFPIYGCAALIVPIYQKISKIPILFRGCLYTIGIFIAEFFRGTPLKSPGICPWDYSHTPFHFRGVIRLDYAPVWFAAGLFLKKYLQNLLEKKGLLLYDGLREFSELISDSFNQTGGTT